jgi:hypothetical protein
LANTGAGSGADTNQARLRWIRTVNAIQAVVAMAGLDDESDRILFSALRAAERTADNRGRSSATTDPVAPTPPTPPAGKNTAPAGASAG